ncbi:hypothetical protein WHI96_06360 [Pseudonocardia tropica]|uniref:Uncharacterized protein n=1 Tax=Pseudonocardia tropica TaxID=681289 RepID=A0ABV1JR58_9PSEU
MTIEMGRSAAVESLRAWQSVPLPLSSQAVATVSLRVAAPVLLGVLAVTLCVIDLLAGELAAGVLPLVAAVAAVPRTLDALPGPDIHDRELDLIVTAAAVLGATALVVVGVPGLALAPASVAVLAALCGTRRLWRLRAFPAVLVLAWPGWWAALPAAPEVQLPLAAVLAVLVLLGVRVGARRGW